MEASVLRLADQRRDVFPDRCVLSGVRTAGATRMRATAWGGRRWVLFVPGWSGLAWALRRQRAAVSIPVSPPVWHRWRRRVVLCQGAVTFGSVLVAVGAALGAPQPMVAGVIVFGGAIVLWARANRNWWVTCVLDPRRALVVVQPTHPEFDRAAREIFVRSIR